MPSPVRKIISSAPKVALILATTTAAVLLIVTAVVVYQSRAPRVTNINYSELYQIAETGSIASVLAAGGADGSATENVSGLAPAQVSVCAPAVQFRAVLVIGPE